MNRRLPALFLAWILAAQTSLGWMGMARAEPMLNGFDLAGASVPAKAIERGGPPKDGIPAIDRPRFVGATSARLADDGRESSMHGDVELRAIATAGGTPEPRRRRWPARARPTGCCWCCWARCC